MSLDILQRLDAAFDSDVGLPGSVLQSPGYHTLIPDGVRVHATRTAFDYALALLQTDEPARHDRARVVLDKVLALQETDPTRPTYGIWPWFFEEPLEAMDIPDWNWADFCGARIADILHDGAKHLPESMVQTLREALGHAGWSIFRRNVHTGYTNIAIMGGVVTSAAGELLDEPRLVAYGRQRLQNVVQHTAHHGSFTEYNSPTYTLVALEECERALRLIRDPAALEAARKLHRLAWEVIAEHWHPGTGQWAGPHSRAYHDLLQGSTRRQLRDRIEATQASPLLVPCPADLIQRFDVLPEPEFMLRTPFIRRDDEAWNVVGTTWFCDSACLGSASVASFWTQERPLLAYWQTAGQSAVLRLRFLHDGKDFASAWARHAQQGSRVLSSVGLADNRSSWHPTFHRPENAVFEASDLRLRYELQAEDARIEELTGGCFALRAGSYAAILHTAPSCMGQSAITWRCHAEPGRACVDAIWHEGGQQAFPFRDTAPIRLCAGLELLPEGQAPNDAPLRGAEENSEWRCEWKPAGETLSLRMPQCAISYPG